MSINLGAKQRILIQPRPTDASVPHGAGARRSRCVWWSLPETLDSENTSQAEQEFFRALLQDYPQTVNRANLYYRGKPYEVDIFVPELPLAIEYDGPHHLSRLQRDEAKNRVMARLGIQLLRVRDASLPGLQTHGCISFVHNPADPDSLQSCISDLLAYISAEFTEGADVSTSR